MTATRPPTGQSTVPSAPAPGHGRATPVLPAAPVLFRAPAPLEVETDAVNPDTLVGVGLRQARRLGDRPNLSVKTSSGWRQVSWMQMHESAVAVGAALVRLGLETGERVAILSENRLEWLHADSGAQLAGCVVVPIYASSSVETVGQILADSRTTAVFCSSPAQAAKVVEAARDGALPALRHRIVFDAPAEGFVDVADVVASTGVDDVAALARRIPGTSPADTLTIIYTSGTTGTPKGVVLTHANVVESTRSILERVPLTEDDHGISFLPWAHVYERVQGLVCGTFAGVTGSVAAGLDDIGGDLRSTRPTIMNGVPRLYEKMQEAITAQVRSAGGSRARLGMRAIEDCTRAARLRRAGQPVPLALRLREPLWRRLVIEKIREGLGGRIRMFSSGGGPINIATLEFFDALGIAITEGYGLTETTGGVTANDPSRPRFGTVGPPTRGHEIRIAEDGEILVRGPGVMKGYFDNPEATAEALRDGWLATGDIGELDEEGCLRITDRKKDLIVTAGGKNVAPAPLEAALMQDPLVERAVVVGDRRKYLVALVVPEFEGLREWARGEGVTAEDDAALAGDERVRRLYQDIAERVSAGRGSYETIKKVAVLERDLSEDAGEITPTLKVKRRRVAESFGDVIEGLYAG